MHWNLIETAPKDRPIIVRSHRGNDFIYAVVRWLIDTEGDIVGSPPSGGWVLDDGHDMLDYASWRGLRRELSPPEQWAEIHGEE